MESRIPVAVVEDATVNSSSVGPETVNVLEAPAAAKPIDGGVHGINTAIHCVQNICKGIVKFRRKIFSRWAEEILLKEE